MHPTRSARPAVSYSWGRFRFRALFCLLLASVFLAAPVAAAPGHDAAVVPQPVGGAPSVADPLALPHGPAGTATTTSISGWGWYHVNDIIYWTSVVSPAGPPAPTGTITVSDGTGATCVITLPATQCVMTNLTAGTKVATATYSGDGTYDPSTAHTVPYNISKANTSVSLTSSANPSSHGSSVTFTATVNESPSGPANPTGTVSFYDGTMLLGTGTVSSNVATYTTSSLSVGVHSITAAYGGDANFNGSTSTALSQSVIKLTSTTSLVSSQNPSVYGQSVTFTATVTGSGGTPTGIVTFDDGNAVLAARALSSGTASFTVSWLEARTHPIRAVYHGDETFSGSNSSTLNQVVNKAGTTATLTRSPSSGTVYGQFVTFTASLAANSPGAGTPTGFVLFTDGGNTIGVGFVDGTGTASFATSSLVVATHSIKAVYGGDANFSGDDSGTISHVVSKADTQVTLTRTTNVPYPANPSVYGQTIILTAVVAATSPGGGDPTGTVTFMEGTNVLGTVGLNLDGSATFQTNALAVGSYTLSAVYGGSANYNGSTSSNMSHTVNKADTTATVVDPASGTAYRFGESFLLRAAVSVNAPGAGIPTGEVRFYFWSPVTGYATFGESADPYVTAPLAPDGSAQTSIPLTYYPYATAYLVWVDYMGDTNFNPSTSFAHAVTIQPAETSIAVTSSLSPSVYGQAIEFVATVSVTSPGAMVPSSTDENRMPTGQVVLAITPSLGPPIVIVEDLELESGVPFNGTVRIAPPTLAVDTYSVQAQYLPGTNPNFQASTSSTLTQEVEQASTKTTLTAAPNPSLSGQTVTLTAAVAVLAPGTGTPSGTVAFKDGGVTIAGCGSVALASGQAVCTTGFATGTHTLTAEYSGAVNFKASTSGGLTQTVTIAPTTVTLTDDSVPLTTLYGQPATFTVAVTAGSGTPTGTVAFRRAGVVISGCGSVALAGGTAQCVTSSLPVGDNPISAVYTPTSDHSGGTSNTIFHTVAAAATTTVLSRAPNTNTVYGQPVTFTAVVSSGSGTPTGTVVFKSDGVTFATQSLSGGSAAFTIASLPVGGHTISAVYLGGGNFAGSTGTLAHTVTAASTTTVVTSSANPSVAGQAVTFSATVVAVAPATGTPTGTVTFKDGAATIGTGTLNGSGVATFTTTGLAGGAHAISAVYAGDGNYATSTGNLPTQTVNPATTTTTVTGLPSPSILGSPVTFTAVVVANPPGGGTPTGSVTFMDGATNIPGCVGVALAGGQATCTTSALSLGAHTIAAVYGGSASFAGSTGTVGHLVSNTPVDLAVIKTSMPNPVQAGTDLTYAITVTNMTALATSATLTDPLPAEVTFVSVTAPAGWTCTDPGVGSTGTVSCSTATLPASGTAVFQLVVHVPLDTPAGTILANTASVGGGLPDPDPTNNSSTTETTVYRFRRP